MTAKGCSHTASPSPRPQVDVEANAVGRRAERSQRGGGGDGVSESLAGIWSTTRQQRTHAVARWWGAHAVCPELLMRGCKGECCWVLSRLPWPVQLKRASCNGRQGRLPTAPPFCQRKCRRDLCDDPRVSHSYVDATAGVTYSASRSVHSSTRSDKDSAAAAASSPAATSCAGLTTCRKHTSTRLSTHSCER